MAIKKFPDFDNKSSLEDADYIVGYNADGTAEFKTTLSSLVEYLGVYFPTSRFIYDFAPSEAIEFTRINNSSYHDWVGDVKFYTNYSNNSISMSNRYELNDLLLGILQTPQSLSKLVSVDLSNCTILSSASIYLNLNSIKNVDFQGCANLLNIDMHQNMYGLSSVNIQNCSRIQLLNLYSCFELNDLQTDIGYADLEHVDITGANSPDVNFLNTSTNLKTVRVPICNLENLDISASYGEIIHLDARWNRISQTDIENILIGIDNAQPASVTPTQLDGRGYNFYPVTTYSLLLSGSNDDPVQIDSLPNYRPPGANGTPTSSAALAAKASLISKGWIVQTNLESLHTPFMYDFAPGEVFEFTKHIDGNSYRIDWLGDVTFHTDYSNNSITMVDRDKLTYIDASLLFDVRPEGFSQPIAVDLSNCTSLSSVHMYLNTNCIKTIDFSGCTNIESIDMHQGWHGITDVDITNCPKLKNANFISNFSLSGIQADSVDTDLENIDLGAANLSNVNFLSSKSNLKYVSLVLCNLENLDISSSYGEIVYLDATFNRINQTDIENILIGVDNAQPASVTPALQQGRMTYSILLSGSNDPSNQPSDFPYRPPGANGTPTSTAAIDAKSSLISKGWIVETN